MSTSSAHPTGEVAPWRDPDKRRAMAVSLTLHLLVLLLALLFGLRPRPERLPPYIVLDVGTPAYSEETTLAATAETPAPPAPSPQVAAETLGTPRDLSAPQQESTAPETRPETVQPPAPQAPPAQAAAEPLESTAADVPTPPLPLPQVTEAAPPTQQLPLAEVPATPLPEIEPVTLAPRPLVDPVVLKVPEVSASVADARALASEPTASVSESRDIAPPQPNASVTAPRELSSPMVNAQVSQSIGLAAPDARAAVTAARPLDAPMVEAQVAAGTLLGTSGVTASVSGTRPLAPPSVAAQVGTARDVKVLPEATVVQVRSVPVPTMRADVISPTTAAGAPGDQGTRPGETDVLATADSPRAPGGNAATSGQTGPLDPNATADGRGLAASPDGVGAGTGAPAQLARLPYAMERERPLAVLIDNVGGYPQTGLREASMILEVPVEGGLTRLMAIYDRNFPRRVGPVRSARDYFVELAQANEAVLVHDGGSPGAMIAIANSVLPTLNAYNNGPLFARDSSRSAPYNLYSAGPELRTAMLRLVPEKSTLVSGVVFAPAADDDSVTEVSVKYSGAYTSGFRFDAVLGAYRWIRDGTPANHPDGQVMLYDAVLVGAITARQLPGDTAGRLYIPLDGGEATLYLKGRAERGTWVLRDGRGVRFVTAGGEEVDLAPFRTWVMLTPTYDSRVEQ